MVNRPRAHSLSPTYNRPPTFLATPIPDMHGDHPVPNGWTSSASRTTAAVILPPQSHTPYYPSRLSFSLSRSDSSSASVSPSKRGPTPGSGNEAEVSSSSEGGSKHMRGVDRKRRKEHVQQGKKRSHEGINRTVEPNTSPLSNRLSRLALFKAPIVNPTPSRTKAAVRFAHRRTQSLVTQPTSYGYILLPQPSSVGAGPDLPRRHSGDIKVESGLTSPLPYHISGPRFTHTNTAAVDNNVDVPPTPTSARRASFNRMMLVNPTIAAHLKRGGVVTMRTPDGLKRWRIRLPKEGGSALGLEGMTEGLEGRSGIAAM